MNYKKVTFIVTILLAMAGAAKAQDSLTARTGMTKPGLGTANWGPKINSNYDIADSSFAVQSTTNVYTSTNTFQGGAVFGTPGNTAVSTFTATGQLLMGNTIQMNGFEIQGGTVTPSAAGTTLVTKAFATNASNLASGTVPNAQLDGSSVTKQGNTFNGVSQLVQLTGAGVLPAISGANLTSLNASNLASGVAPEAQVPHTYASSFTVTAPLGEKVTYNLNVGSITPTNLTATKGVYYDGNTLVSDPNETVTSSSETFAGINGVSVKYQLSVGSFTGAGLSTCGDSSHALAWSSVTNTFTCQSITGTAAAGGNPGQIQYNLGGSLAGFPSVVTASSVTISTPTLVMGTITNDDAPSGFYGEVISTGTSSPTAMSTGSGKTICSILLTPGQWQIVGLGALNTGGNTVISDTVFSISTTDHAVSGGASIPDATGQVLQEDDRGRTGTNGATAPLITLISVAKVASTTRYYLVVQSDFTTSTLSGIGSITATRIR